jgi:NifU-like protein involved in Fe-S cluster formation
MNADPYSATVRKLFARPAHAGEIEGDQSIIVDDQDVVLELGATVAEGIVAAMRFRARACPHVIAAAETACASLEGRPAAELLEFSASGLMQSLPVPVEKTGRILVLEDAVRALGQLLATDPGL